MASSQERSAPSLGEESGTPNSRIQNEGRAAELPEAISAFESGNYPRALRLALTDELRGCALVFLGSFAEGLPLVLNSKHPRSVFCSAVAMWGLGGQQEAIRRLRGIQDDSTFGTAALRLLGWMTGPPIRLALQGRDDPGCPNYDVVGAFRKLPHLEVKTIGYSNRCDVVTGPTTLLNDVLLSLPHGWQPDFYLCHMLEDHPPPIGIEAAPFPTFCHTQDYDRHFHHCFRQLSLFDAVITLGSVDHGDMVRFTGKRAYVFPLLLGVDFSDCLRSRPGKDIDVYISGKLFDNNVDKTRFIYAVSQLPVKYKVVLHNGYVGATDYFANLARAKCTFTFVNRWGLINGRALEAINQGCSALYQEGGELGLYMTGADGAVPYGENDLEKVMIDFLDHWDQRPNRTWMHGARRVRELFDFQSCIRKYSYVLAAHAALEPRKEQLARSGLWRMRHPNRSPGRILYYYDFSPKRIQEIHGEFQRAHSGSQEYEARDAVGESYLYAYLADRLPTASGAMAALGPLRSLLRRMLSYGTWPASAQAQIRWLKAKARRWVAPGSPRVQSRNPSAVESLREAMRIYERLCQEFPDRIAARFNLGRLHVELQEGQRALESFLQIARDASLRYRPDDLLFWREFHDSCFDYDFMMRELVNYRRTENPESLRRIESMIRASSRYYASPILEAGGDAEQALEVLCHKEGEDFDFPALWSARIRLKLRMGRTKDAEREIQEGFRRRPWFLATHGEEICSLTAKFGLHLPEVESAWGKLRCRLVPATRNP